MSVKANRPPSNDTSTPPPPGMVTNPEIVALATAGHPQKTSRRGKRGSKGGPKSGTTADGERSQLSDSDASQRSQPVKTGKRAGNGGSKNGKSHKPRSADQGRQNTPSEGSDSQRTPKRNGNSESMNKMLYPDMFDENGKRVPAQEACDISSDAGGTYFSGNSFHSSPAPGSLPRPSFGASSPAQPRGDQPQSAVPAPIQSQAAQLSHAPHQPQPHPHMHPGPYQLPTQHYPHQFPVPPNGLPNGPPSGALPAGGWPGMGAPGGGFYPGPGYGYGPPGGMPMPMGYGYGPPMGNPQPFPSGQPGPGPSPGPYSAAPQRDQAQLEANGLVSTTSLR